MAKVAALSSEQRRGLAAAIICTSAVGTSTGMLWPLLSLILNAQGVDDRLIGLSSATQSLAGLSISPFAPLLIARTGMRSAAGGCILVILASLVLLRLFEHVEAWFAIRFVLGAAATTLFISTQTWVNQLAPDHVRGRIVGVFGFLWSAGYSLGPLTIRFAGSAGWPPFLVAIVVVTLAGAPLLLASEPSAPAYNAGGLRALGPALRRGRAAIAAALFLGVMDSTGVSFLPLYGLRNGLDQASAVTLLFIQEMGILAVQLPIGWAADHISRGALMLALTLLALLVSLLLPSLVGAMSGLWLGLFLLGVATGGIWTVSLVLAGQLFADRDLASALALRSVLYGLGSVLGPSIGGLALGAWSRSGLPVMFAVTCILFALGQTALRPRQGVR